jgi:prefoldin subunit 5
MRSIIIVGGIVLSVVAISRLLRRKRSGPMRRARKEMQKAVGEVESTIQDLSKRARKLKGEAKETIDVQVRALEGRREELMERLQSVANESRKKARKSKEPAEEAAVA